MRRTVHRLEEKYVFYRVYETKTILGLEDACDVVSDWIKNHEIMQIESDKEFVIFCYEKILNRGATKTEIEFWRSTSRENVIKAFLQSEEFIHLSGLRLGAR